MDKAYQQLLCACLQADEANSRAIRCASTSQRTQRSGVSELEYILRPDRRMCEDVFFRTRMTPDQHAVNSAEDCRREIDKRNVTCHLTCGEWHEKHERRAPSPPRAFQSNLECALHCPQIHATPIVLIRLDTLFEVCHGHTLHKLKSFAHCLYHMFECRYN